VDRTPENCPHGHVGGFDAGGAFKWRSGRRRFMNGKKLIGHTVRLPAYVLMGLIWVYQKTVSPMLGDVCRYYPSCSKYGFAAIGVHGAIKGTLLTVRRISRCTPFHSGGLDPVPPKGRWRVEESENVTAR